MLTNLRVKIDDIFNKNKYTILFIIVLLFFLNTIMQLVNNFQLRTVPITTRNDFEVILDEQSEFPSNITNKGVAKIRRFLDLANENKFDEASELLSDETKQEVFVNQLEAIGYLQSIFDTKKIYDIRPYTKVDDNYIYQVRILNDILETGLTNEEFNFYDMKIAVKTNGNDVNITTRNFIGSKEIKGMYEDNNIRVELVKEKLFFMKERYRIRVTNRTKDILVINDYEQLKTPQIQAVFGNDNLDKRKMENMPVVFINPLETLEFDAEFAKMYDGIRATALEFNALRFYSEYIPIEQLSPQSAFNQSDKKVNEYSIKVEVRR